MLLQMALFQSFYGQVLFHCICTYTTHIVLSPSSVDAHLAYCHVVAAVRSAAMNIEVDVSF